MGAAARHLPAPAAGLGGGAGAVTPDDRASTTLPPVDRVFLGAAEDDAAAREVRVLSGGTGRKGQAILSLDGVSTLEAAEALRGRWVLVDRAQLPPLEEGEYLHRDLLGLAALGEDGAALGAVSEVVATGPVVVLVLRDGPRERFVPFTADHVLGVDLEARTIRVSPPAEEA